MRDIESTSGGVPARRPPDGVAALAYYHWVMGGTMLASAGLLDLLTRSSSLLVMSGKGYAIILGLGLLYGLTGTLVWFGLRPGLYLNYGCSLIYLARPRLGLGVWAGMRRPEFKAHFSRRHGGKNKN